MSEAILRLRHLRKTLPDGRRLLDVPELVLRAGELLLLTGENGAGKTTLLKIVAALEPPDCAEVEHRGRTRSWRRARRHYRREVVYLHQQPFLFSGTVAANVAYGLKRARWPAARVRDAVGRALAWAGIEALAGREVGGLSGGERQRVALARAWALAPRLLLLDEPTTGLDPEARERAYRLVERLRDEGMGLVVASHEPEALAHLADRWLHVSDGALHPRAVSGAHRPTLVWPARPLSGGC